MAPAIPFIMAAVSAIGTGVSAMASAKGQEAEATMMRANADAAAVEAKQLREAGLQEQAKLSRQKRKLYGEQTAQLGAAGIGFEGSPIDYMVDSQAEIERDMATMGWNTEAKVRSKRFESNMFDWQAEQKHKQAVYGQWYSWAIQAPMSAMSSYGGSKGR